MDIAGCSERRCPFYGNHVRIRRTAVLDKLNRLVRGASVRSFDAAIIAAHLLLALRSEVAGLAVHGVAIQSGRHFESIGLNAGSGLGDADQQCLFDPRRVEKAIGGSDDHLAPIAAAMAKATFLVTGGAC